jgi:hypothetical protein
MGAYDVETNIINAIKDEKSLELFIFLFHQVSYKKMNLYLRNLARSEYCHTILINGNVASLLSWSQGCGKNFAFLFDFSNLTNTLVITTPAINPPM